MKIKDLENIRGRRIVVIGKIIDKKPIYTQGTHLFKAKLEDDTGVITLNLWGSQKDECIVGDTVKVKNAFIKRRYGICELHTWNHIEVIKNSEKIIDKT